MSQDYSWMDRIGQSPDFHIKSRTTTSSTPKVYTAEQQAAIDAKNALKADPTKFMSAGLDTVEESPDTVRAEVNRMIDAGFGQQTIATTLSDRGVNRETLQGLYGDNSQYADIINNSYLPLQERRAAINNQNSSNRNNNNQGLLNNVQTQTNNTNSNAIDTNTESLNNTTSVSPAAQQTAQSTAINNSHGYNFNKQQLGIINRQWTNDDKQYWGNATSEQISQAAESLSNEGNTPFDIALTAASAGVPMEKMSEVFPTYSDIIKTAYNAYSSYGQTTDNIDWSNATPEQYQNAANQLRSEGIPASEIASSGFASGTPLAIMLQYFPEYANEINAAYGAAGDGAGVGAGDGLEVNRSFNLGGQPAGAASTLYTVDPTTQTVQGQMNGLLDQNSQYMQLARQGAMEQANQAGLLNSTLAGTAGERAAIESALPIAQQDAQTYFSQANLNQNAENNFELFNTEFKYNDYFKESDFQNQTAINSQQNQAAMDLQSLQDTGAMARLNTELDANKLINDANNSIDLEKLAQSSDETFSEVTGKIDQQYISAVNDVMNNDTLTEDSRKIEIADLKKARNESIVLQSELFGVDISVYEDLIDNSADNTDNGTNSGSGLTDTKTIGDRTFVVQPDGNLRDPLTGEVFTEATATSIYNPTTNNNQSDRYNRSGR